MDYNKNFISRVYYSLDKRYHKRFRRFIKFLKDKECIAEYIDNVIMLYSSVQEYTTKLKLFYELYNEFEIIDLTLIWRKTNEGDHFWHTLHTCYCSNRYNIHY